jgi:predicted component of type VI protein secretion system
MARSALHLVVSVFDFRIGAAVEEVFTRFPVSVGRGSDNDLQLAAPSVSRRQGLFGHQAGSPLTYMDLGSANGTFVDGIQIEPMEPIPLRDSSVIAFGPYQLTFHLRHGRPREDRRATGPISVAPIGPAEVSLWKASLARSEAIRRIRAEHGPSDLLRRAAEVIELLAEMLVLFRPPATDQKSILRSSRAPDEIAAYLLSPAGGRHALRELRDVLTELFMVPQPTGAPT